MGSHHYVTTDYDVLRGWPKTEKNISSVDVAKALGLTVFQITARLKGMEKRAYVARNEKGLWGLTPAGKAERANPSPSVTGQAKTMRAKDKTGNHSGPPDDSKVPRIKITRLDWAPSNDALKEAQQRLPEVLSRLSEYQADKKRYKREIMALQVEKEHCEGVINAKRRGKWTSRVRFDSRENGTTIYIAPDMREYVMATPWETADIIIENPVKGISDTRLRLYSTSSAIKGARKDEEAKQTAAEREEAKKQAARNKRVLSAADGPASGPIEDAFLDSGITWNGLGPGDQKRVTASRRAEKNARFAKRYAHPNPRDIGQGQDDRKELEAVRPARNPGNGKVDTRTSGNNRVSHGGKRKARRR